MSDPILSPTHDNDVLILEGVLNGVYEQGAKYGLTHARRDLLAHTLEIMLQHVRQGTDDAFLTGLGELSAVVVTRASSPPPQTGRPSHPEGMRRGDTDLPDSPPRLTR